MPNYKFDSEIQNWKTPYQCAHCDGELVTPLKVVGVCTIYVCNECNEHTIYQPLSPPFPWKNCLIVMVILVLFALWIVS